MTEQEAQSRLWTVTEPGVPLFLAVTLTIRPDRLDPFVDALHKVLPPARAEEACLFLNVGRSVADPTVFVLWEGWRDLVEFREIVLQKDYYREYVRASEDAYAEPRVVTVLDVFR